MGRCRLIRSCGFSAFAYGCSVLRCCGDWSLLHWDAHRCQNGARPRQKIRPVEHGSNTMFELAVSVETTLSKHTGSLHNIQSTIRIRSLSPRVINHISPSAWLLHLLRSMFCKFLPSCLNYPCLHIRKDIVQHRSSFIRKEALFLPQSILRKQSL